MQIVMAALQNLKVSIVLAMSPLKRLQTAMVCPFRKTRNDIQYFVLTSYIFQVSELDEFIDIHAVVIYSDMHDCDAVWQVCTALFPVEL